MYLCFVSSAEVSNSSRLIATNKILVSYWYYYYMSKIWSLCRLLLYNLGAGAKGLYVYFHTHHNTGFWGSAVMLSCLPCGQADPVDRAIKEAENLRNRDRQRINREIEKGDIRFQTTFYLFIIILITPYTKH